MLKILRAKLHGIRVTASDLNYHGSVTLDSQVMARAGIYPLEFVYIWNRETGSRISTYVLSGEPGSRCCILNGAAARTCQIGDALIISAFEYVQGAEQLLQRSPRVLTFKEDNEIAEELVYRVNSDGSWYNLAVEASDL